MLYVQRRYTATAQGATWKPVQCERCSAQWAYRVTRKVTGQGVSPYMLDNSGAQQRASAAAQRTLDLALKNASDDVPCPRCLSYQADAAARLRKAKYQWMLVVGLVGVFGALMFGAPVAMDPQLGLPPLVGIGVVLAIAALGVAPLLLRFKFMAAYDPNADELLDGRRSVLAGKQTMLREQYEEILRKARAEGREDQVVEISWAAASPSYGAAPAEASLLAR